LYFTFNDSRFEVLDGVLHATGQVGVAPVADLEVGTGCKHRRNSIKIIIRTAAVTLKVKVILLLL
jgi:hypothetical protein